MNPRRWRGEDGCLEDQEETSLADDQAANDNDVHNIVMSYLAHNCLTNTFESFTASTGMKQTANRLEDKRREKLALERMILKVIELIEQFAPGLLEKNKNLHFDLLSLHFVGLVCSRKCTEAMKFAQVKLSPFGKVEKHLKKLEDFIALLAYNEPKKSPMFHLLSLEYREQVVDSLNRAILENSNLLNYSAVKRLMQ
ncbi:glucose-induced degradation protein 8-B homolog [Capsicum annuum]|uniref:glucose-induced degradation protein 8-B homolog n=1 Tax=Capsicum annuum TaxID=4072 RepID=UPI001FB19057|nr:glucose-induced degradation protein 8-B homolog [Capsicum annuum]